MTAATSISKLVRHLRCAIANTASITGNVLGSQWRAVDLRNVSRVTITGNSIYDSADLSVFAARSAGIVVSGNTFVWRGNDSEPPKDGLRFEDCDNVLLTGLATQRLVGIGDHGRHELCSMGRLDLEDHGDDVHVVEPWSIRDWRSSAAATRSETVRR